MRGKNLSFRVPRTQEEINQTQTKPLMRMMVHPMINPSKGNRHIQVWYKASGSIKAGNTRQGIQGTGKVGKGGMGNIHKWQQWGYGRYTGKKKAGIAVVQAKGVGEGISYR